MEDIARYRTEIKELKSEINILNGVLKEERKRNIESIEGFFSIIIRQFHELSTTGYHHTLREIETSLLNHPKLPDPEKSVVRLLVEQYNGKIYQRMVSFKDRKWKSYIEKEEKNSEEYWGLVDELCGIVRTFYEDANQIYNILLKTEQIPIDIKESYNLLVGLYNNMMRDFTSFFTKFAEMYGESRNVVHMLKSLPI